MRAVPVRCMGLLLALAGPLTATAQVSSQVSEGQMIGRWKVTCADGPCRAFLTLQQGDTNVLTWQLLGDGAVSTNSMILTAPLGTALPPGLRVQADEATVFDVPFQVCDEGGCVAVALVTAEMRAAIGAQDVVRVAYVRYGEPGPVAYEVPVDGFGRALDALRN